MNLVTVIVLLIALWVAYSFVQSYRGIEKELKEIRIKCVAAGASARLSENTADPYDRLKDQLVSGLRRLAPQ
jgi:hypothetical protein